LYFRIALAIALAVGSVGCAARSIGDDPPLLGPPTARSCDEIYVMEDQSPAAVREKLWLDRYKADPVCDWLASRAWMKTDLDRAVELFLLAHLRWRYDVQRCRSGQRGMRSPDPLPLVSMGLAYQLEQMGRPGPFSEQIARLVSDPRTYDYSASHLRQMCLEPLPRGAWPSALKRAKAEALAVSDK